LGCLLGGGRHRVQWGQRAFSFGTWGAGGGGLNSQSHHDATRELIRAECMSIVCFQETRLSVISDYDVSQIIGVGFDYFYLPAVGTHGGILVAWRSSS
jgi:hypothetical protein